MKAFLPQKLSIIFLLQSILVGVVTGCSVKTPSAAPSAPSQTLTLPEPTQTTIPITSTPEQPTPEAVQLFLADPLPDGLVNVEILETFLTQDALNANFWFGPAINSPEGEQLLEVSWTYALTAPFPTLSDGVSEEDLIAFWKGIPQGTFADQVQTLYIPDPITAYLREKWGEPSPATIKIYQKPPKISELWAEPGAWLVLPFHKLDPQLKVISINGLSPLSKDFHAAEYPLMVNYELIQTNGPLPKEAYQSVSAAIAMTNHDPAKMTTLIMTGVTALVRATAYKMEVNGVLYPGEDIVHWLADADLTHISNEVSFYEHCPEPDPNNQSLFFCSDPSYIQLFEFVGADIIELTGNHNNDSLYVYGVDVVPFTLELYRSRDMTFFGGGENLSEAMAPMLLTHNGNQFAFIGCNASGPDFAWATDERGGAAPCGDYQWMADEISRLRQMGYLPIATFQYYENYSNYPSEQQSADFGLMAEAGAVIVNGSQAHRPKAIAFMDGTFIHYGLGNLFFDQMGVTINGQLIEQTRWEIIQRHTFYDGRHLSTELLTAMLEDYARPRPMTPPERVRFLEELFSASGWGSR